MTLVMEAQEMEKEKMASQDKASQSKEILDILQGKTNTVKLAEMTTSSQKCLMTLLKRCVRL